ncbi:Dynamin-like GTPase that mediates homotypic ER fusion [Entomophthora muscae]|uniref:Dynamin-like GTPase that mediates homotypic ER fusion n=1 Tax=Entomophthora muscae TaxID=34485 RepID=A0ACC2U969_9FUNG|nr:Dynamin-like GTPase that mediates homotypic ER fusion [Entomophthora muscae]
MPTLSGAMNFESSELSSESSTPAVQLSPALDSHSRSATESHSESASEVHHSPLAPIPEVTTVGNVQLQVIDENQNFSPKLTHYMKNVWNLGEVGFNYNLVAVFGSQSTGKSTLLNALFSTEFDTMTDFSRQQTTRGLWMSLAKNSNTLVMDVEGVDGRERGEDQDFERKSALFSMAVAQVVLVNLWENQVGLYNGANIGLLKTVFEVNLELFQQKGKGKTLLLFVIRDYLGKVPLSHLSQTLKQDLQKAWAELAKPKGLEGCAITDFFDFMFFGLPHRILLAEDFDEQVQVLGQCFYDSQHPNYVFRPQYHKRIPADGLQRYSESIWEQIVKDKNLDLPTQQQLLAQFRCDEIAAALFDKLVEEFKPHREAADAGVLIEDLGNNFTTLKDKALADFDAQAGRYHAEVYQKKRTGLSSKIDDYFHVYFKSQLSVLSKDALTFFSSHLKNGMCQADYDFVRLTKEATEKAKHDFTAGAAKLSQGFKWSHSKEERDLDRELAEHVASCRRSELAKLEGKLAISALDHFEEDLPSLLSFPQQGMWEEVLMSFAKAAEEASLAMKTRAEAFELSPDEVRSRVADVRVRTWEVLISKIKEEVASDAMLLSKLRQSLEAQFRYDADGLPRVWLPDDDIDVHFKNGKAEALDLLPLLSRIDISSKPVDFQTYFAYAHRNLDFKKSLILASQSRQADLEQRFKRESDALYLEAKRSIVATSAKVPYWVLLLLLILGWNEILYVISSPLMFVFAILVGAGLYAVHTLKLMGPLLRVIDVIGNEIYRQVQLIIDDNSTPHQTKLQRGPSAPKGKQSNDSQNTKNSSNNKADADVAHIPGSGDFED